jgi:hypothetical protein
MPFDDGQADAGALELRRRVQAAEDAEGVVAVRHVEADAVVAHEEGVALVADLVLLRN